MAGGWVADYSVARPGATALKAAGATGAMRYIAPGRNDGAQITAVEIADFNAQKHNSVFLAVSLTPLAISTSNPPSSGRRSTRCTDLPTATAECSTSASTAPNPSANGLARTAPSPTFGRRTPGRTMSPPPTPPYINMPDGPQVFPSSPDAITTSSLATGRHEQEKST